ncbi:ABC-2 type transport system permease protein [Proteiniborus ethanoligenes]|uniref:ABC-2 type transport system permease protein n=1 Tax=Proteiniborus ethanoligenes TaxID=415015 RepID=A0A1H3PUE1_9FIRM|nr:ABC transporter permease [Proteiniborus ethanoligenes]SDZ04465.1 ABC-2 type transport system permease protein [Proteiniborus ethanoligenes]
MLNIIRLRLLKFKDEYLVLVMMTAMALIFTYLMGAAQNSDYTSIVAIIDKDNTEYSARIIDELKLDNTFIFSEDSYQDSTIKVEEGKILAAVVLEEGFENKVKNSESSAITIMRIKEDRDIYTLESLLSSIVGRTIVNYKIAQLTGDYLQSNLNIDKNTASDNAYRKVVEAWRYKKPVTVMTETLDSTNKYDNMKHMTLGFALFFSMYTIAFGVGEILTERENNTWQRLLISPASKFTILGGKFVTAYLIGVFQIGLLLIGGKYLFKMDFGDSFLGIMVVGLAFVFTTTSLGLFLAGLVKTHSQLSALLPVVLTSTSMLGGCMWPLDIVNSKILLGIANFMPQKWALEGMEKIAMYGSGFNAAIMPTFVLVVMGLIFFILGVKLVRFE